MKKRFLAFMLSLAMAFSLLPMAAYAEDDVTSSIETTETQSDILAEAPDGTTTESDNEQPPAEVPAPETPTSDAGAIPSPETTPETSKSTSATVNAVTRENAASSVTVQSGHVHSWSYYAQDNIVSAICSGDGSCRYKSEPQKLVLYAKDMGYTGSAYNGAIITVNHITYVTGATADSIKYEGRDGTTYAESDSPPVNVGEYTAKVTIGGRTATANFKIKPVATTTVNFTTDLTYNGKNQNLVKNATTTGGTLMYRLNETDEWQAGLVMLATGKDAGDYHIQYYVKADANSNYADSEVQTATVTIQQKDITVTITPNGGTYGNVSPATAVLNDVISGDDVSPALTYTGNSNSGQSFINSSTVPTDAGGYVVSAGLTGTDAGNYNLTGSTDESFHVQRANPNLSVTAVPEKNYGDANFTLEVTKNGDGALTCESSDTSILTVDVDGNVTLHKAGTATITVKVAQTANYYGDTKTVDVTVKKVSGNLEVTILSYTKTYGDAPFSLGAESTTGTVSYKSSNEDVVTVAADGTVTIHNKGMAIITVSVPEGDNHTIVSKEISITVMPKAITVKAKDASKIYGDADSELTYEVLNNGLVGNDTLENIKVWRDKGENVVWLNDGKLGGYTIHADYDGIIIQSLPSEFGSDSNGNYTITYEPGMFTIKPRDISGANVTLGNSLTYNGKEQTQTITKVVVDGIEVPADAYTVTGNTAKDAGTYTLTITAKEGGNFTGARTVEYTIAKADDKPTDPTKPSDPTKSTDPTKPTNPTKPGQTDSPKTGDSSQTFLWLVLMLSSICGLAATILFSRKVRYKGRYTE